MPYLNRERGSRPTEVEQEYNFFSINFELKKLILLPLEQACRSIHLTNTFTMYFLNRNSEVVLNL